MTKQKIRVLLADDYPVTQVGVRTVIDKAPDMMVVGEASNGIEVKQLVAALKPDVLLLDLLMPGPRPSDIEKWIQDNYPHTLTIVLTAHDKDCYLSRMIDAGVVGFLSKEEPPERILRAIRRVCQGENLITTGQQTRANHWREEIYTHWRLLTRREREVMQFLVQGLDNATIAHILGITEKTAAYHVANILNKLGVNSRLEAVVWVKTHLPEDHYMILK